MTKQQRAAIVLRELKRLYPVPKMALNYRDHWQLLVSVILSAQCTDKKVNQVTNALFKKYKILDDYLAASHEEFEQYIRPTGFYKAKTKNILATAKFVKEKYGGKIPKTLAELITLPGVGRKTANVVLGAAHGICEGIAVDTHVARLSKKFHLSAHTDPKKIEQDLIKLIPKDEWVGFTHRMILYGREHSPAHKKQHTDLISLLLNKKS